MDPDRAREMLASERSRIEADLRAERPDEDTEGFGREEPGDEGSEGLYEHGLEEARLEQLNDELAAVERAEARLAEGTYGLSVESGKPIPDARLAAMPTAERTVEEDEPQRRS